MSPFGNNSYVWNKFIFKNEIYVYLNFDKWFEMRYLVTSIQYKRTFSYCSSLV